MAKIELKLSSRRTPDGRAEVMIRFFEGKKFNLRSGSGIFVDEEHFGYVIDREKTEAKGKKVSSRDTLVTKAEAERKGYVIKDRGEIIIPERLHTDSYKYHIKAKSDMEEIKTRIIEAYQSERREIKGTWLIEVINPSEEDKQIVDFYKLGADFLERKNYAYARKNAFKILFRECARYAAYKDYVWDIDTITRNDIDNFRVFLGKERELMEKHPKLYKVILKKASHVFPTKKDSVNEKGSNYISQQIKYLLTFLFWCVDKGFTENRQFFGYHNETPKYGEPYYLSIDERNHLADFPMSGSLAIQRDIFIFQCLVGCRVGDLYRLTDNNIDGNMLHYVPDKTVRDDKPAMCHVPLTDRAMEIIERYRGLDRKGRLLPFVCDQKYNKWIKEMLTVAGITRKVTVINPTTGHEEIRPINEIGSSHMARRTFVGGLYKVVQDPALIGKMSGHVEGSRAFARYRSIETDLLKEAIEKIK